MKNTPKISVCMATYNGALFLREQLDSILLQLGTSDEIIVVDDGSSDTTISILEGYKDTRICIFLNPKNLGAVRTFERAIMLSTGDHIFLSDQDDVWLPGRVAHMGQVLQQPNVALVVSNYDEIDQAGNPVFRTVQLPQLTDTTATSATNKRLSIMLGKMNYFGCAMAFTRAFAQQATPFPRRTECHDIWLAILAIRFGGIAHLPEPTLARRLHGSNLSLRKRALWKKLRTRLNFCLLFFAAQVR